jgi:hypothetical protein
MVSQRIRKKVITYYSNWNEKGRAKNKGRTGQGGWRDEWSLISLQDL